MEAGCCGAHYPAAAPGYVAGQYPHRPRRRRGRYQGAQCTDRTHPGIRAHPSRAAGEPSCQPCAQSGRRGGGRGSRCDHAALAVSDPRSAAVQHRQPDRPHPAGRHRHGFGGARRDRSTRSRRTHGDRGAIPGTIHRAGGSGRGGRELAWRVRASQHHHHHRGRRSARRRRRIRRHPRPTHRIPRCRLPV
ncbi:Uncharacterised protein [Mycobacteroides abscessus subsp. bolletii]|nr:Uncharacterised protein [Mycobacteroides abscessus subsp. bolletii]